VRRERRCEAGSALREHFEKHADGTPGAVDLALDKRHVDEQARVRRLVQFRSSCSKRRRIAWPMAPRRLLAASKMRL
jgi:hypothetical protein